MDSKTEILNRLAAAGIAEYSYPEATFEPQRFADPTAIFVERLHAAGGEAVIVGGHQAVQSGGSQTEVAAGGDICAIIRQCYPDALRIASTLPEITCATFNPDKIEEARELDGVDVAVIDALFGVAENGAVWVRQDVRHKALYFASTALVILLPKEAIVDTMQDAVLRPEFKAFDYGCFISGPSKTADIEQALVIGAHGPMSVTVLLR